MLFLNGAKVAGPNVVGPQNQLQMYADVTYAAGELVAVPCNADGSLIPGAPNATLRTAGAPARIALVADHAASLQADRR